VFFLCRSFVLALRQCNWEITGKNKNHQFVYFARDRIGLKFNWFTRKFLGCFFGDFFPCLVASHWFTRKFLGCFFGDFFPCLVASQFQVRFFLMYFDWENMIPLCHEIAVQIMRAKQVARQIRWQHCSKSY